MKQIGIQEIRVVIPGYPLQPVDQDDQNRNFKHRDQTGHTAAAPQDIQGGSRRRLFFLPAYFVERQRQRGQGDSGSNPENLS